MHETPRFRDREGSVHKLKASDIVVLTRTNKETVRVEKQLLAMEIPCYIYKKSSLFSSIEAFYLQNLIQAALDPSDNSAMELALLTPFFAWDYEDLGQTHGLAPTHPVSELFEIWNHWLSTGHFNRFFQSVLQDTGFKLKNCLNLDFEESLSAYLQIMDSLRSLYIRENWDAHGLLQGLISLREKIRTRAEDEDSYAISSDNPGVSIMTMHMSKGLEFPVVFLAGGFKARMKMDGFLGEYHETRDQSGGESSRVLGVLPSDSEKSMIANEEDQEERRLFYVACTRASLALYLPVADPAYMAIGKWLNPILENCAEGQITKLKPASGSSLAQVPSRQSKSISSLEPGQTPTLKFPRDHRNRGLKMESFSGLKRKSPTLSKDFVPGLGNREKEDEPEVSQIPELELPGGIRTGNMLHDILENLDYSSFSDLSSETVLAQKESQIIESTLHRYGFDPEVYPAVEKLIRLTLNTPLFEHDPDSTLVKITNHRLNEMDFYLSTPSATQDQSFLRGAVDLIFEHNGLYYLADWKSNQLGGDYGQDHLMHEMQKERYLLQAEIYTLAFLDFARAALPSFDPKKQIGGVLYLFLRGMQGEPGQGVFHLYKNGLDSDEVDRLRSRVMKEMGEEE